MFRCGDGLLLGSWLHLGGHPRSHGSGEHHSLQLGVRNVPGSLRGCLAYTASLKKYSCHALWLQCNAIRQPSDGLHVLHRLTDMDADELFVNSAVG
jgi:hypothetical protein